jgi:hypothetical protein
MLAFFGLVLVCNPDSRSGPETVNLTCEYLADVIHYGFTIPHNTLGVFSCTIKSDHYDLKINNEMVIQPA